MKTLLDHISKERNLAFAMSGLVPAEVLSGIHTQKMISFVVSVNSVYRDDYDRRRY